MMSVIFFKVLASHHYYHIPITSRFVVIVSSKHSCLGSSCQFEPVDMVSVLEKLKMYAQTGQSLKETQAQELQRLVEVVKPFMENECVRSVCQAKGLPLLRSYSSDTTQ